MTTRMPVVFIPHGGGPWPFVELGLPPHEVEALAAYLRSVRDVPRRRPRALLVVSAHWEEPVPTVQTAAHPPILYDYYGFPPESYAITWPAPGDPWLSGRVRDLLDAAGWPTSSDAERGFDHGTFIPLKLTYPDADIPAVQLSLRRGLDPAEHIAIGGALAPLRDEEVFIIGSGMTFHNLRAFRDPRAAEPSREFDAWIGEAATAAPEDRAHRLARWRDAPHARFAHPREEHLLPLMVSAGAAGGDRGQVAFRGTMAGAWISAFQFGM